MNDNFIYKLYILFRKIKNKNELTKKIIIKIKYDGNFQKSF